MEDVIGEVFVCRGFEAVAGWVGAGVGGAEEEEEGGESAEKWEGAHEREGGGTKTRD